MLLKGWVRWAVLGHKVSKELKWSKNVETFNEDRLVRLSNLADRSGGYLGSSVNRTYVKSSKMSFSRFLLWHG